MGTSLSGLTPATTFDGLLKVGDNDPLTADLKAISTGDGTDTILSLSNSALSIGGTVDINFAGQTNVPMQFYGAGAQFHYISGGNNLNIEYVTTAINENVRLAYAVSNRDVSIGQSSSMGAKLGIKGSGATSATTSLLVQNSAGSELFKVADNGLVNIIGTDNDYNTVNFQIERSTGESIFRARNRGALEIGSGIDWISLNSSGNGVRLNVSNSEIARIAASGVGIGETTPTARLHIKGSGNDNTTTSLLVQNSDATELLKINDDGEVFFGDVGKDTKISLRRSSAGSIMGSIEAIGNGFYLSGYQGNSNILFGRSSTEGITINNGQTRLAASLGVKGLGATSATTALLVQNSAGTELFKVQDDGRVNVALGLKISNLNVIDWDAGTSAVRYFYQSGVGNHVFYTNSGTERMKLNNDGNLGIAETTPTARLQVKGSGNDATTTALLVQNSDGADALKVTDDAKVSIDAIKLSNIKAVNSDLRFDIGGTGTIKVVSDKVAIGGNTTPTARLQVKGSGATSATTALLVENSAGTDLLNIRDDGQIRFNAYYANNSAIFPTGAQNLGVNNVQQWHFGNVYSKGVTHITDNTTSSTTLDASAKLQVDSTTQGFLPPRMTDAERDAIATPAAGLMIYDTSNNQMNYWNGSTWIAF